VDTRFNEELPQTKRAKQMIELVKNQDVKGLHELLTSINPEVQFYGVLAMESLQRIGFAIPEPDQSIINHLKERNAQLVVCSGCFDSKVDSAYSEDNGLDSLSRTFRLWNQLKADTLVKPSGYVNDFEDLFSDSEEDTLTDLIQQYEEATTNQIAIVTIPRYMTQEEDFDDFTLFLFNKWGVGQKGKDNGILIGISKDLRKMRIQNGYGIAEIFSDAQTKQVVDEDFIPLYKQGKYYEGTLKGLKKIISLVKAVR
jgi:uncharacterized protein